MAVAPRERRVRQERGKTEENAARSSEPEASLKLSHSSESPSDHGDLSPDMAEDPLISQTGSPIEVGALLFNPDWYVRQYPDVAAAKLDAVKHYFDNGFREGRNPNRYFDTSWYSSNNPDVSAAGLNPFLHYVLYGAREGRKPAP